MISTFFIINVTTNPGYGEDCGECHQVGQYTISTNSSIGLSATVSTNIDIYINGSGPDVIVQVHPDAMDNDEFTFLPGTYITDNSLYDSDSNSDAISVLFNITTPEESRNYKILILVRSPEIEQPDLAYLEFDIVVSEGENGNGNSVPIDIEFNIFSHFSIYLGGIAVASLAIGTVLYNINKEKYTKIHGYCAGISFILTTINIIFIVPLALNLLEFFFLSPELINWNHLLHIIIGTVGYIAGCVAFITGLSGIRSKIPGYIALSLWSFNFFQGILIWGIRL